MRQAFGLPLVFAGWLGLTCMGCGLVPLVPKPALRIALADFERTVRTICVSSVSLGFEHPREEEIEKAIAAKVGATLRSGGFDFQPEAVYREAFQRQALALGGPFDPYTGYFDEVQWKAVTTAARTELKAEHGCDAFLTAHVVLVRAELEGDAAWDGIVESIGVFVPNGWVSALSLWITVQDANQEELYFHTGGIQSLVQVDPGFFYHESRLLEVDAILADDGKLTRAVELALAPLVQPPSMVPPPPVAPSAPALRARRAPLQPQVEGERNEAE